MGTIAMPGGGTYPKAILDTGDHSKWATYGNELSVQDLYCAGVSFRVHGGGWCGWLCTEPISVRAGQKIYIDVTIGVPGDYKSHSLRFGLKSNASALAKDPDESVVEASSWVATKRGATHLENTMSFKTSDTPYSSRLCHTVANTGKFYPYIMEVGLVGTVTYGYICVTRIYFGEHEPISTEPDVSING